MTFKEILARAQNTQATDIYLGSDQAIYMRSSNEIHPLSETQQTLSRQQIVNLLNNILTDSEYEELENKEQLKTCYNVGDIGLFKLFIQFNSSSYKVHLQPIHSQIPPAHKLGMEIIDSYANNPKGLNIIAGPQHSGKTHTLSSFLNQTNLRSRAHILYLSRQHYWRVKNINSLITQVTYENDLIGHIESALNLNPDIIFIDDLKFKDFVDITKNFEIDRPFVLGLTNNSILDFLHKIRVENLQTYLGRSLNFMFQQKLIFSFKTGGKLPIYEWVEKSEALKNLIENKKNMGMVSYLSQLDEINLENGITPLENRIFSLVKANILDQRQAIKFAENQPFLMQKLSLGRQIKGNRSTPLSSNKKPKAKPKLKPRPSPKTKPKVTKKNALKELSGNWTDVEHISLEDE